MKLCIDCKYSDTISDSSYYKCKRPFGNSVVDGKVIYVNRMCENERSAGILSSIMSGECGISARYFEPK